MAEQADVVVVVDSLEEYSNDDEDSSYEEVTIGEDDEGYDGGESHISIRNVGDEATNYSGLTDQNIGDDYSHYSQDVDAVGDDYDEEYLEEVLADDIEEESPSSSSETTMYEDLRGSLTAAVVSKHHETVDDDEHVEEEVTSTTTNSDASSGRRPHRPPVRRESFPLKRIDESSHPDSLEEDKRSSSVQNTPPRQPSRKLSLSVRSSRSNEPTYESQKTRSSHSRRSKSSDEPTYESQKTRSSHSRRSKSSNDSPLKPTLVSRSSLSSSSSRSQQRTIDQFAKVIHTEVACPSIAVLGSLSGVGKSVMAAGICRIFANGGTKCAPFKGQHTGKRKAPALLPNLSSREGLYQSFAEKLGHRSSSPKNDQGWGQIGLEQSLQAKACRILPRVEMNPLLFRTGKSGSCAMIAMGKEILKDTYENLSEKIPALQSIVLDSHKALAEVTGAEVIVVQGAGACSEVHLLDGDIVNLPLVRCLEVVGTKLCVTKRDWDLCAGVIINKIRGDPQEFLAGMGRLQKMVGKPLFAVPHLEEWTMDAGVNLERKLGWETSKKPKKRSGAPVVVVVAYPHATIWNDLDALEDDERFCVEWRRKRLPKPYPSTTAMILPNSRLTLLDLKWLHDSGWVDVLREHVVAGGTVLGLCGGYQMLGWDIKGDDDVKQGIGLLPISSTLKAPECNMVDNVKGQLFPSGVPIEGLEMDCGSSIVVLSDQKDAMYKGLTPLLAHENGKPEGMLLGRVQGTYMHGILRSSKARLELLVPRDDRTKFSSLFEDKEKAILEDPLDRLAQHLQSCGLDYDRLCQMAHLNE